MNYRQPSLPRKCRAPGRTACLGGLLAFALLGSAKAAEEVYKCTNPQGAIAFQDHACADGEAQSLLRLADPPVPASNEAAVVTSEPVSVPATAPIAAREQPRLPALWSCTRYDGSRYMSTSGIPQQQAVPLGVLGYPPQSLAQAYGNGRSGLSAPGIGSTPTVPARGGHALAADYVWTQDTCTPANVAQTCTYLHEQYDENHRTLRNAAKADQPPLEARERELRDQLGGC